jgi:superoxide reductase
MEFRVFKCNSCGSIVFKIKDKGANPVCCGQNMKELVPGETDGAVEKHVPVAEVNGSIVTVTVGEVEHPMAEEHYIEFIAIVTSAGVQIKELAPGQAPKAVFALAEGETFEYALDYCNLHGLWRSK